MVCCSFTSWCFFAVENQVQQTQMLLNLCNHVQRCATEVGRCWLVLSGLCALWIMYNFRGCEEGCKQGASIYFFVSKIILHVKSINILRHLRPCKYLHAGLASCGFGRFLDFMRMDRMDRIDQYVDLLLNFVEGPRHIMYHHLMCCTCFVGWHICEFLWHPTVHLTDPHSLWPSSAHLVSYTVFEDIRGHSWKRGALLLRMGGMIFQLPTRYFMLFPFLKILHNEHMWNGLWS
jgi:hypothetical protein